MKPTDLPRYGVRALFSEAGNCVEVADLDGRVLVRDTKLSAGPSVLVLLAAEMARIHCRNKPGPVTWLSNCRPAEAPAWETQAAGAIRQPYVGRRRAECARK